MAATEDPVKLRRQRSIAWYVIFALFFSSVMLAKFGFQGAGGIAFMLIFPALIYVVLLGSRIRRAEKEQAKLGANEDIKPIAKEDIKLQPYWRFLVGNLLFAGIVASICSSSPFSTFIIGFVVLVVLLPMALSAGNKSRELQRQRWSRFAIYAVAVFAGWMIDHQASENEQRNFNSVIAAVEQYKAAEKHYPDTLAQLVPKYLTVIPAGRWHDFMYDTNKADDAHLFHMLTPPVKETYDFKSKKSRTWD